MLSGRVPDGVALFGRIWARPRTAATETKKSERGEKEEGDEKESAAKNGRDGDEKGENGSKRWEITHIFG